MRYWPLIGLLFLSGRAIAQMELDRPIHFNGATTLRGVDGIAQPTESSQLITVGTAVLGIPHWATAQFQGSSIELTTIAASTPQSNGLLLRFLAPSDLVGDITVVVDGATGVPLVRPDGLQPIKGQIRANAICEIIFTDGQFVLLSPERRGCPPGALGINSTVCIDSSVVLGLNFFEATSYCANAGGRLCAWDEFYTGCSLTNPGLGNLFVDWEWVDDTANHTHTVGQVGRTTCMSQRSTNTLPVVTGSTRCCYHLR